MVKVDARGDACPLPVVKAKKAIAELNGAGEVEILVDNEIAVQNLTKMAQQKGLVYSAEKLAEREYSVRLVKRYRSVRKKQKPVHRIPVPIQWLSSPRIRWARGPRNWAKPCSKPLYSRSPSRINCPRRYCSITAAHT